jgi:hypothetical protein
MSIASSSIPANVVALLSLKSKEKYESNAPTKVTLAAGWEDFTSVGIFL